MVILDGETLLCAGKNDQAQLGNGEVCKRLPNFVRIPVPVKFSAISQGDTACVAISEADGSLWSWGSSNNGLLGLSTETTRVLIPTQIPNTHNFVQVSAGAKFALALTTDGHVCSFGWNYLGQLGLGDYENRFSPTMIETLPTINAISAGLDHAIVLDTSGEVWSFGDNSFNQFGISYRDLQGATFPHKLTGVKEIVQIASGNFHNLLLDSQSRVWAFGSNFDMQLGRKTTDRDHSQFRKYYSSALWW